MHAVVGVVDYQITFGDQIAQCGGISGVATMPGQRSQSLVNVLLEEACRDMNHRGVAFSALYPFSYPFYERSGYAATHWEYRIQTECAWLKRFAKAGNAKQFRYVPKERGEEILPVYDRWQRQFNLNLNRWDEKLKSMLTWPGRDWDWRLFLHDDGYLLMNIHRGSEPRVLRVPEFAYLNEQAYMDGLALMAQMVTQFDAVRWVDYDVDALLKRGVPYPKPTIHREPNMMMRVVNRAAFEKLLPNGLGRLRLVDPLGVSGELEGDVGVGEIVQIVTGFFAKPDERCPQLHRVVAEKSAFCIEKY